MEQKAKDHTETLTSEETVRRALRHREPARRFHYPELGNPLVSVVTSLFQGPLPILFMIIIVGVGKPIFR